MFLAYICINYIELGIVGRDQVHNVVVKVLERAER
jgi:hypothetical protein